MDNNEVTQQASNDAETSVPAKAKRRKPGRPPGSGTKQKAAKKKISKKKASKKAGKKTASKKLGAKKTSKKKRGKKKTIRAAVGSDSMTRLLAAVEELREAVVELAHEKAQEQQTAVSDLRQAAQARIADIEEMAGRALKKLGF